jgi:hypothetical protein
MQRLWLFFVYGVLMTILSSDVAVFAQTPANSLILSKDLGGTIARNTLTMTLRANPACDQTGTAFPDETRLLSEDLEFATDRNNLGVVSGTVRFVAPDGQLLQVMMLRGMYGLNARREADRDCRLGHLEAQLEPVPTFAPPNIPQLALATLSADVILEAAGPLPAYRAKLDGVVTLPPDAAERVTVNPDKNSYGVADAITAVITNGLNQPITVEDMKSYCTIIRLQRQDGGNWEDVGECLMRRRSFMVTIGAGETRRITLLPGQNANTQKRTGVYRMLLDYAVAGGANSATDSRQAVSPSFRVNSMPARQGVRLVFDGLPEYVDQGFAVRVLNDTDMPIQTTDHKSNCTILDVERNANGTWAKVAQCQSLRPTRLIRIEPSQSYDVKLSADSSSAYPPGTYRVEFIYQIINATGPEGQTVSADMVVRSPEFILRER